MKIFKTLTLATFLLASLSIFGACGATGSPVGGFATENGTLIDGDGSQSDSLTDDSASEVNSGGGVSVEGQAFEDMFTGGGNDDWVPLNDDYAYENNGGGTKISGQKAAGDGYGEGGSEQTANDIGTPVHIPLDIAKCELPEKQAVPAGQDGAALPLSMALMVPKLELGRELESKRFIISGGVGTFTVDKKMDLFVFDPVTKESATTEVKEDGSFDTIVMYRQADDERPLVVTLYDGKDFLKPVTFDVSKADQFEIDGVDVAAKCDIPADEKSRVSLRSLLEQQFGLPKAGVNSGKTPSAPKPDGSAFPIVPNF